MYTNTHTHLQMELIKVRKWEPYWTPLFSSRLDTIIKRRILTPAALTKLLQTTQHGEQRRTYKWQRIGSINNKRMIADHRESSVVQAQIAKGWWRPLEKQHRRICTQGEEKLWWISEQTGEHVEISHIELVSTRDWEIPGRETEHSSLAVNDTVKYCLKNTLTTWQIHYRTFLDTAWTNNNINNCVITYSERLHQNLVSIIFY